MGGQLTATKVLGTKNTVRITMILSVPASPPASAAMLSIRDASRASVAFSLKCIMAIEFAILQFDQREELLRNWSDVPDLSSSATAISKI